MPPEPLRIELRHPCPKRWQELEGTGPQRHCSSCNLSVTHLSLLTRAEAEPVLAARAQGRVCIAYRTDARGHVLFADFPLRPSPRWLQAAATFLALFVPFLPGCRRPPPPVAPPEDATSPPIPGLPLDATLGPLSGATGREPAPTATETLGELEWMGYGGE